jgi:hypothetical protein
MTASALVAADDAPCFRVLLDLELPGLTLPGELCRSKAQAHLDAPVANFRRPQNSIQLPDKISSCNDLSRGAPWFAPTARAEVNTTIHLDWACETIRRLSKASSPTAQLLGKQLLADLSAISAVAVLDLPDLPDTPGSTWHVKSYDDVSLSDLRKSKELKVQRLSRSDISFQTANGPVRLQLVTVADLNNDGLGDMLVLRSREDRRSEYPLIDLVLFTRRAEGRRLLEMENAEWRCGYTSSSYSCARLRSNR